MSVNEKMTAIADNIRSKTGKTEPLNLDDMASGVEKVYEAGKKKEWSDFWDVVQKNGTRTNYDYAFYGDTRTNSTWTDDNFNPKYSMFPSGLNRTFTATGIQYFGKIFRDRGLVFDTSNCTYANMTFAHSNIIEIGELNLGNATAITDLFMYYYSLTRVEKLILSEKITTNWNTPFIACNSLKEIRFGGVIHMSLSFSSSPLTVESMKSIITHLKNYAGTESSGEYTLTLKDTCKALMAEQGEIEEFGGKTYDAYIADIGWNLA